MLCLVSWLYNTHHTKREMEPKQTSCSDYVCFWLPFRVQISCRDVRSWQWLKVTFPSIMHIRKSLKCLWATSFDQEVFTQTFLSLWRNSPNSGPGRPAVEVPISHTQLDTPRVVGLSSERVISPSQRPLPTQHTNTREEIDGLSGIRTRDTSNRVPAGLDLRLHGHPRRLIQTYRP